MQPPSTTNNNIYVSFVDFFIYSLKWFTRILFHISSFKKYTEWDISPSLVNMKKINLTRFVKWPRLGRDTCMVIHYLIFFNCLV